MTDEREQHVLLTWLNDAHTLEHALAHTLESHAGAAKSYPWLQEKLRQHLEQTRHHEEWVRGCIERRGGKPSVHHAPLAAVAGAVQGLLTGAVDEEEVLKNSISDSAAEYFEIATYQALLAMAQDSGDIEVARICQDILRDETEMARWLDEHMSQLTRETLRMTQ